LEAVDVGIAPGAIVPELAPATELPEVTPEPPPVAPIALPLELSPELLFALSTRPLELVPGAAPDAGATLLPVLPPELVPEALGHGA
jgi:hypothetical protein